MPYAVIAYNSTIHSKTQFTPFELVLGHTDRDPMNLIPSHVYTDYINNHKNNTQILYETVAEKSRQVKEKVIDKINEKRSNEDLIIGCQIYNVTKDNKSNLLLERKH